MHVCTVVTHEQMMTKQNMRFTHRYVTTKTLAIPLIQTTIIHDNIYDGPLSRIIVNGIVTASSSAGEYKKNLYHFINFGRNHIVIVVD